MQGCSYRQDRWEGRGGGGGSQDSYQRIRDREGPGGLISARTLGPGQFLDGPGYRGGVTNKAYLAVKGYFVAK